MKKLMTLMLGLSFLAGTVSLFAQDQKQEPTKKEGKKKGGKKKKDEAPKKEGSR
jgi:hypothetical protein